MSLFAESFNEMLMRDFGFTIYKKLSAIPVKKKEKAEEEKVFIYLNDSFLLSGLQLGLNLYM